MDNYILLFGFFFVFIVLFLIAGFIHWLYVNVYKAMKERAHHNRVMDKVWLRK